jgi:hypothetical protein
VIRNAVDCNRGGSQWTCDGTIRECALEKAAVPGLQAAAVAPHGAQLGEHERSALHDLWQAAAGREGRSANEKTGRHHRQNRPVILIESCIVIKAPSYLAQFFSAHLSES